MRKTKDVSDEDEYSADDPEEVEEASEEEWTPAAGSEGGTKKRPQRQAAKKRHHAEEDEDEDDDDDDEDDDEEEEEEEESNSDTGKKPKRKRRYKKEEDDEDDSDDNSLNESPGESPKDYTSGSFVIAKADIGGKVEPTLWRIDGKILLQKFLPFKEGGKTLYKSTSAYSAWSADNKDKYLAAQVTFMVQTRSETIVELHLDRKQLDALKEEKED